MGAIPALKDELSDRPLAAALVVYGLASIPAYLLVIGQVGTAGTVDASPVIGGLLMGSLLFVPALTIRFKRQYGGGQAKRLGFIEGEES